MEAIKEILSAPSKWTLAPEQAYSCDQVIDAYLKGKSEGIEQTQKLIMRQLDRNVSETVKQTDRIIKHLASKGFHPVTAYIKIDEWDAFTILVTVPDKEWCNPQFLEIFNYVIETEQHVSNEFYRLGIQLFGTPDAESINEQSIFADGFILKLNIA
jgi:ferritin